MSTSLKLCSRVRIHGYHHFLLGIHQVVTMLNLLMDPLFESLSQDGRTNVHEPLLWDLWQVNLIRKVTMNNMLVTDIQKDLLNRQVLVLWYIECFHLIILDILLSTSDDILEKVNRDVLCRDHMVKCHDMGHLPYGGR